MNDAGNPLDDRFLERSRADAAALRPFMEGLLALDTEEERVAMLTTAHRLAAGGERFGHPAIAAAAGRLELVLRETAEPDPAEISAALGGLLDAVEAAGAG